MKKLLLVFLLILSLLFISSCNLSQGTRTLPAPKTASPTVPPLPTATTFSVVVISATPKAGINQTAPANSTPAKATLQATATIDLSYPATPNAVVQAYVTAYPNNTDEMLRYLSSAQKSALPAGGPAALLNIQGDVNGFAITSGSQASELSEAEVVAAMLAGGKQVQRTFTLVKENNYWVISSIH